MKRLALAPALAALCACRAPAPSVCRCPPTPAYTGPPVSGPPAPPAPPEQLPPDPPGEPGPPAPPEHWEQPPRNVMSFVCSGLESLAREAYGGDKDKGGRLRRAMMDAALVAAVGIGADEILAVRRGAAVKAYTAERDAALAAAEKEVADRHPDPASPWRQDYFWVESRLPWELSHPADKVFGGDAASYLTDEEYARLLKVLVFYVLDPASGRQQTKRGIYAAFMEGPKAAALALGPPPPPPAAPPYADRADERPGAWGHVTADERARILKAAFG